VASARDNRAGLRVLVRPVSSRSAVIACSTGRDASLRLAGRDRKIAAMNDTTQHGGWLVFAGIMILIAAVLNCIWGIAAIDKATFFIEDERFILADLSTWGWIILLIGVLQLFAAFSIFSGGSYGRWVGIISASLGAIGALLSIPGYPFWSLAVFFVDVLVIYGLAAYGGQRRANEDTRAARTAV
jgi:hypothetical protein